MVFLMIDPSRGIWKAYGLRAKVQKKYSNASSGISN
jgi:hypothetical protein